MTAVYKSICEWLDPDNLPAKDLSEYSSEKLKKALEILIQRSFEDWEAFTRTSAGNVWLVTKELMDRGFAPRWIDSGTEHLLDIDHELFDLYWLTRQFPRHQTLSERWDKCFDPEVGERKRLMEIKRIAELSSYSRRKKQRILNLQLTQKVCCKFYADLKVRELRERIRKGRDRAAKRIRAKSSTTKAQQNIGTKLRWWECARLVGKSNPSDMAVVYSAMTGTTVTRQAAGNAVKSLQKMGLLSGKSK